MKGFFSACFALLVCMGFSACGEEAIGCTDPLAVNYDPDAEVDNGSCLYDECTELTCINGDCVNDLCACYPGFFGIDCQFRYADFFEGDFDVAEVCQATSDVYSASISPSPVNDAQLLIDNLYNSGNTVIAEIQDYNLIINQQSFGIHQISGSGLVSQDFNSIDFNYTIITSSITEVCSAEFTRR